MQLRFYYFYFLCSGDYLAKIKDVVNKKNLSWIYGKFGKTGMYMFRETLWFIRNKFSIKMTNNVLITY